MLFITAGMGGGTGTGAAPVIAKAAKDRGILTVAVVTIPYQIVGITPLAKAIDGIHELKNNVDSLLVINNEKLYELFGSMLTHEAFPKADEVLATAVRNHGDHQPARVHQHRLQGHHDNDEGQWHGLDGLRCRQRQEQDRGCRQRSLKSPLLNDFNLTTAKNLLYKHHSGQEQGRSDDG